MTRPSNRFLVVLITLVGIVGVFAIAYSGAGTDSQLAYALRIVLATTAALVIGAAIVRRDLIALVIGAGLVAWSFDTFYPQRGLTYLGSVLFVAGFFLTSVRRA